MCMYVLTCVCVYIYSIELDSTVSEYYAYYPINHLNAYLNFSSTSKVLLVLKIMYKLKCFGESEPEYSPPCRNDP